MDESPRGVFIAVGDEWYPLLESPGWQHAQADEREYRSTFVGPEEGARQGGVCLLHPADDGLTPERAGVWARLVWPTLREKSAAETGFAFLHGADVIVCYTASPGAASVAPGGKAREQNALWISRLRGDERLHGEASLTDAAEEIRARVLADRRLK